MKVVIAKVDEIYFDGEADSVTVPGQEGEMTILGEHEPLISTLKKGAIVVRTAGNEKSFPVDGGILEVRHEGVTVIL